MSKFALVCFGNEESYGMLYAGTEFKKHGEIRFFDAEMTDPVDQIVEYAPDYLCFSPMTTFYPYAKAIENRVKQRTEVVSVYGGHHASNCGYDCGDITVVGSCFSLSLSGRGIIRTQPTISKELRFPAREEYFRDIPRMRERYRKVMLSVVGCPFHCTYCSSKHGKELLDHRDINDVMAEAEFIKNSTHEIEWVDDDVFAGNTAWLMDFYEQWQKRINLPMYVSTTSINALKAPSDLLIKMRKSVNCIGMGVQAIRPSSLKLMGRSWDNKAQIKQAYDRLTAYGFKVNLQGIVGLPIEDPVEDALDTVDGLIEIGKGSICSVYPLQIYPNTAMQRYCLARGWRMNQHEGDTNSGLPGIDFGYTINNQLRNICKLATMAVKFGVSKDWLRAMLDVDLSEASKDLSMIRYKECVMERLPNNGSEVFDNITRTTNVRY